MVCVGGRVIGGVLGVGRWVGVWVGGCVGGSAGGWMSSVFGFLIREFSVYLIDLEPRLEQFVRFAAQHDKPPPPPASSHSSSAQAVPNALRSLVALLAALSSQNFHEILVEKEA